MKQFDRMRQENNCYYFTKTIGFQQGQSISKVSVDEIFNFCYDMTYAGRGAHRNHRSGGRYQRGNGEIFTNAFQGKLAEYALHEALMKHGIQTSRPDMEVYGHGKWDVVDLEVNGKSISIKSTKHYGQLLLLEEKDWGKDGSYLPNNKTYDYTFLIRLKPSLESLMKNYKMFYSNNVEKKKLHEVVTSEAWYYDIPGYIKNQDLTYIINNNFRIPRGSLLQGKTSMDASNYYVQIYNMRPFSDFVKQIKN